MKFGNPRSFRVISVLAGLFILLAVVSACSSGDSDVIDLLEESILTALFCGGLGTPSGAAQETAITPLHGSVGI